MIPHLLSEAADKAAIRYDNLSQTFAALHKTALLSRDFGTVGHSQKLFEDAYDAAGLFFDRDKQVLEAEVTEIAQAAHRHAKARLCSIDASELSDAALTHLSEIQTYVSNEIAAQVHRDIANIRHSLQRAVLTVGMIARSRGVDPRKAQINYVMQNDEEPQLVFTDRRGRRTPTRSFVRALYRQALLSVWNEVVLHTLADHGLNEAVVVRAENGETHTIGRLSIEAYASERDSLFHPNSNAYLDLEQADV